MLDDPESSAVDDWVGIDVHGRNIVTGLGLMVKAVEEEHEPVTAVAIAAGITRERYHELRRATEGSGHSVKPGTRT